MAQGRTKKCKVKLSLASFIVFRYGTSEPPSYDFSLVRAKIVLYYCQYDDFIPLECVEYLEKALSNADVRLVYKKKWDHCSFLYATNLSEFYQELISIDGVDRY